MFDDSTRKKISHSGKSSFTNNSKQKLMDNLKKEREIREEKTRRNNNASKIQQIFRWFRSKVQSSVQMQKIILMSQNDIKPITMFRFYAFATPHVYDRKLFFADMLAYCEVNASILNSFNVLSRLIIGRLIQNILFTNSDSDLLSRFGSFLLSLNSQTPLITLALLQPTQFTNYIENSLSKSDELMHVESSFQISCILRSQALAILEKAIRQKKLSVTLSSQILFKVFGHPLLAHRISNASDIRCLLSIFYSLDSDDPLILLTHKFALARAFVSLPTPMSINNNTEHKERQLNRHQLLKDGQMRVVWLLGNLTELLCLHIPTVSTKTNLPNTNGSVSVFDNNFDLINKFIRIIGCIQEFSFVASVLRQISAGTIFDEAQSYLFKNTNNNISATLDPQLRNQLTWLLQHPSMSQHYMQVLMNFNSLESMINLVSILRCIFPAPPPVGLTFKHIRQFIQSSTNSMTANSTNFTGGLTEEEFMKVGSLPIARRHSLAFDTNLVCQLHQVLMSALSPAVRRHKNWMDNIGSRPSLDGGDLSVVLRAFALLLSHQLKVAFDEDIIMPSNDHHTGGLSSLIPASKFDEEKMRLSRSLRLTLAGWRDVTSLLNIIHVAMVKEHALAFGSNFVPHPGSTRAALSDLLAELKTRDLRLQFMTDENAPLLIGTGVSLGISSGWYVVDPTLRIRDISIDDLMKNDDEEEEDRDASIMHNESSSPSSVLSGPGDWMNFLYGWVGGLSRSFNQQANVNSYSMTTSTLRMGAGSSGDNAPLAQAKAVLRYVPYTIPFKDRYDLLLKGFEGLGLRQSRGDFGRGLTRVVIRREALVKDGLDVFLTGKGGEYEIDGAPGRGKKRRDWLNSIRNWWSGNEEQQHPRSFSQLRSHNLDEEEFMDDFLNDDVQHNVEMLVDEKQPEEEEEDESGSIIWLKSKPLPSSYTRLGGGFRSSSLLQVEFKTGGEMEPGIDGGGLLKEFLMLYVKELCFHPSLDLFKSLGEVSTSPLSFDSRTRCLLPSPFALKKFPLANWIFRPMKGVVLQGMPCALDIFKAFGIAVGKSLTLGLLLPVRLHSLFFRNLSEHSARPFSGSVLDDLKTVDPVLHNSLKDILALGASDKNDYLFANLGLVFAVEESDANGKVQTIPLVPGGMDIPVKRCDRLRFAHLFAQYHAWGRYLPMLTEFRRGLNTVVPNFLLNMFDERELLAAVCGSEGRIDFQSLRSHTVYASGYFETDETPLLFWKVVERFTPEEKEQLLQFATGSSRPPLKGFGSLYPPFTIARNNDASRLPSASTCVNMLVLPDYRNEQQLEKKLKIAIAHSEGFSLS